MGSEELTDFLIESIEGAIGPVRTRTMFGGLGLWKHDSFLGMIWGDALSIRLDEAKEPEYIALGFVPNDPSSAGKGRRRYYEVPGDVIEDPVELERWLTLALEAAR